MLNELKQKLVTKVDKYCEKKRQNIEVNGRSIVFKLALSCKLTESCALNSMASQRHTVNYRIICSAYFGSSTEFLSVIVSTTNWS